MELRHLKSFLQVSETLNISAAARRLNITQPALSRQIHELEAEVGRALFVRQTGGLMLTAAGQELKAHGAKALDLFDATLRAVSGDAAKPQAHLRLAYAPTLHLWTCFMAPALTRLQARHPGLTWTVREMTCGAIIAAFHAGELDAALLSAGAYPRVPGVAIARVAELPVAAVVAADHPLAKKRQLEIGDLREQEIIGFSEAAFPGRDDYLIAHCRAAGFEPRIHRVGDSLLDAIAIGRQRGSVGIAANLGMKSFAPGVLFVPFRPPGPLMPLFSAAVDAVPEAVELREMLAAECARVAKSLLLAAEPPPTALPAGGRSD